MNKMILTAAVLMTSLNALPAQAAEKAFVDYSFLAECAAFYSVKASETQGKIPADTTNFYYEAASSFYEKSLGGDEVEMKAVYKEKISEFTNVSPKDAVTNQYKRALEKQCAAIAPEHGIRLR